MHTYVETSGRPSGRAIAITVAAHMVLGWLALNVAGVAPGPIRPGSITVADIPRPAEPPPDEPEVEFRDEVRLNNEVPTVVIEPDAPVVASDPPVEAGEWSSPYAGLDDYSFDDRDISGDRFIETPPAEPPIVEARLDRRYLDRFQPEYPYGAKRRGEEGTVVVEVRIGPDGRVRDASVAESSGSRRLDQAAVEQAERRWRFVPATRGDEAVESVMRISVVFDLQSL
ncbi:MULTISPECIES: energy transducer TonB [Pacificimonas]|nr:MULTISPECIES: energy transducer TonB [Pacificimonas]MBZ6379144.1 energy transducer TonB [Pacificimonas aurantium]